MRPDGVIQRKFALLDKQVLELQRHLAGVDVARFGGDWALRSMTERAVQVIAEIVIDVAERIIALKGAGPAATAAEAIGKLAELGVIQSADPYVSIVRMRNLIVHQYEEVDPAIVFDVAVNKLGVLRQFRNEIDAADI